MGLPVRSLVFVIAVLGAAGAAHAGEAAGVLAARRRAYEAAMTSAAELADRARRAGGSTRRELALQAVELFRQAARDLPGEPEPFYHAGSVQADLLGDSAGAVASWERVRALAPDFIHDADMSFRLGIELSRLGRFRRAIREYDRAAGYTREVGRPDIILGNSAEAAMGAGLLDEAIRRYRQALAQPSVDPLSTALHLFGLAVALDRDEQIYASREVMTRALALDPERSSMEAQRGVFFVPEGDRHYYDALALLAAGRLAESRHHFERFLEALPASRYAPRARAHLAALVKDPRSRAVPVASAVQVGDVAVPWTADRGRVVPAVVAQGQKLRACRPTVPPFGRGATTRVTVSLAVDFRGRPTEARVRGGEAALNACVYRRVAAWRFPRGALRPGGRLSFAVTFAPREP